VSAALDIAGLTVVRGGATVVDGVTFTAPAGAVTALIGANGAGKSSVLKAVLGLLPAAGSVRWAGEDLRALPAAARARRLGYVPQRSLLHAALSGAEVVAMARFAQRGALARLSAADGAAVAAALARAGASAFADRRFDRLSCGEAQRVLIARALAGGARAILLDEPTAGLDIGQALAVLALLRGLAAEGCAVLAVLHDLEQVRACADGAVLLQRGRVLAAGPVAEVLAAGPLRAAFAVAPVPGGALGFRAVPP
jgi:iron complex transport system ATP-binding protein